MGAWSGAGTSDYLLGLWDESAGGFRFHEEGEATLLSTAFALHTLALLSTKDAPVPGPVEVALHRLTDAQDETGAFRDPLFDPADLRGRQSPSYVEWQFTFFSLGALEIWGRSPRFDLNFVDELSEPSVLDAWLGDRNWQNFWLSSNELMFLLVLFLWRQRRRRVPTRDLVDRVLDTLAARQNPRTGFFGETGDPRDGVFGAAHVLMFYDALGRRYRGAEGLLEASLSLLTPHGLVGPDFGGACEDFDVVEVALSAARSADDSTDVARRDLMRMYETIARCQDRSGGFAYRLVPAQASWGQRLRAWRRRRRTYRYSGWTRMTAPAFRPDTWGTFFRVLTLASIEVELLGAPVDSYRFSELPFWGFGPPCTRPVVSDRGAEPPTTPTGPTS